MNPTDANRFSAAIAALGEAYRQKITAATIHAYDLGLEGLTIQQVEVAVKAALRSCKFMPTPAELRELSGEVKSDGRALLAWDAFQRAVVQHGGYRSVQFDDPITNATIRNLGGWQRCCEMPPEEFDKWLRKDFLATYQALHAAGAGSAEPLVGIHAQQNTIAGKHHGPSEQITYVRTGIPGLPQIEAPDNKQLRRDPLKLTGEVGRMPG